MNTYTVTMTDYNSGDKDRVATGLTLDESVIKVVRNIYGHDNDIDILKEVVLERGSGDFGATFFCSKDTGQVSVKLENQKC